MINKNVKRVTEFMLILLWVYAALSKLLDYGHFQVQMNRQILSAQLKYLAVHLLPAIEIITAILLGFRKTALAGLWVSLFLLTAFTIYILLAILHVFKNVPCSCGGVLEHLGWTAHFYFNFTFWILNLYTIITYQGKEVTGKK